MVSTMKSRTRSLDPTRLVALVVVGLLACGAGATNPPRSASDTTAVGDTARAWTLVWSDEFDGPANTPIDSTKWLYDLGTHYPGASNQWGTGEIETMTASLANVSLDGGGHLAMRPVRDANGNWTSARIETQRNDFQPSPTGALAVEASIQQPNVTTANGLGYWPAFWMLGGPFRASYKGWPSVGEIDILENINGRPSMFGTFHCGTSPAGPCNEPNGIGSGERGCLGCLTAFHTYRVEWDRSVSPQQLRWYLDGTNYFTVSQSQVDAATWTAATNHGYMIIFDLAIGGGFPAAFGGGPTAATVSGVPMLVDYVRVYQR